jgi:uncharacterized protein (DUF2267 family)
MLVVSTGYGPQMKTTEMIRAVSLKADLEESDTESDTEAAIDAPLRTLAERINGDEARHLAAQLPVDIAGSLLTDQES